MKQNPLPPFRSFIFLRRKICRNCFGNFFVRKLAGRHDPKFTFCLWLNDNVLMVVTFHDGVWQQHHKAAWSFRYKRAFALMMAMKFPA